MRDGEAIRAKALPYLISKDILDPERLLNLSSDQLFTSAKPRSCASFKLFIWISLSHRTKQKNILQYFPQGEVKDVPVDEN